MVARADRALAQTGTSGGHGPAGVARNDLHMGRGTLSIRTLLKTLLTHHLNDMQSPLACVLYILQIQLGLSSNYS